MVAFSKPQISPDAFENMRQSLESYDISGDGPFTRRCHDWLGDHLGSPALLTHSCTGALEMAALLAEVGPGDEVIMPSFTFVSTANAFVLRGAKPVFVDIRPDTLNLDERLLAGALTERTKAVVPVHYAGIACDMDPILEFSRKHNLIVIEDAAQGYLSRYKGQPLGTLSDLGCLSFHVSKNVVSGEGGAIIINTDRFLERAHIIREKGTNRTDFLNHKVDKYEWIDVGSSYLPSDILAALLLSQFEHGEKITARRMQIWQRYQKAFESAERNGLLRRPVVPDYAEPNGHIYYVLLPDADTAKRFRLSLLANDVAALTHYVPLHSSPAGTKFGRVAGTMDVTNRVAATLIRLTLYPDLPDGDVEKAISCALRAVE